MIDHVSVRVNNLLKSRVFYEHAFLPFKYKVSFGKENIFWAFDIGNGALFEIVQDDGAAAVLTPCHIAFRAESHEQVNQFHEAALQAGGKCNGAPGKRPQYTADYYAAFVFDPNGHNIEAVFGSN